MRYLQEVVRCATGHVRLTSPWCRVELQERVLESIIQFHNGCLVTAAVAVVRCAEDGHNIALMAPVIALHYQLMSPGHKGEAVSMVEGF